MKTYNDLEIWKKGVDFVVKVYDITKSFPKDEIYGITNQMRRAAVSIPSNIAEGSGRNSNKEFVHFLYISYGSCLELETQILISERLGLLGKDKKDAMLVNILELRKMISGLIKVLKEQKEQKEQ